MTNTFEENFFKKFLDGIEEEREIFSLLTDSIAELGKEEFKALLKKIRKSGESK